MYPKSTTNEIIAVIAHVPREEPKDATVKRAIRFYESLSAVPWDIAESIDAFVDLWIGSDYGPAHIVLADYNVYDAHLDSCLASISNGVEGYSEEESRATKSFLDDLKRVPEDRRLKSLWQFRPYMEPDDG